MPASTPQYPTHQNGSGQPLPQPWSTSCKWKMSMNSQCFFVSLFYNSKVLKHGLTNRLVDGPTEKASCRVAWTCQRMFLRDNGWYREISFLQWRRVLTQVCLQFSSVRCHSFTRSTSTKFLHNFFLSPFPLRFFTQYYLNKTFNIWAYGDFISISILNSQS